MGFLALAVVIAGVILITQSAIASGLCAIVVALLIVPFTLAVRPYSPGVSRADITAHSVRFSHSTAAISVGFALAAAAIAFAVFGLQALLDPQVKTSRFFLGGLVLAVIVAVSAVVEAVRTFGDSSIVVDETGVTATRRDHTVALPWSSLQAVNATKGHLNLYADGRLVIVAVRRNFSDPDVIAALIRQWIDEPASRADFTLSCTVRSNR